MRYPYFDILFAMAQANVAQTDTLRLHFDRCNIQNTEYGPTLISKTFYATPEGDRLISAQNGGRHRAYDA